MKNYEVYILGWQYRKRDQWYRNMVSKGIKFFTGSKFTHTSILINNWVYESNMWRDGDKWQHGVRKVYWPTCNWTPFNAAKPLGITDKQIEKALWWFNDQVGQKPYNFLQLISLALVYPTRGLWNWIGWTPFSHEIFGEVCSTFVDEGLTYSGFDVFPNRLDELSTPGNYFDTRPEGARLENCPIPDKREVAEWIG